MKAVLLGILGLVLVGTLIGAGTMAYFIDTATSEANQITGGTFDFSIKDPSTTGAKVLDITGLKPGQTVNKYLGVANDSTAGIDMKWKAWFAQTSETGSLSWATRTAMSSPRYALAAARADNGKIYSMGGWWGGYLNSLEEYDPTTNIWTSRASMSSTRGHPAAAAVGSKIYVVGGYNGSDLSSVAEYDTTTNAWVTKSPMPDSRQGPAAAAVNGKVYVFGGGKVSGTYFATTWEYDSSTDTWVTKTSMPTSRAFPAAATVNGKLYVIGGFTSATGALNTVEEYDPTTDSWSTKAAMPTARERLAAVAMNNRIYAIGGQTSVTTTATVEEYNPATDTWATKSSLPAARVGLAAAVSTGKLFAIGGRQGETDAQSSVYAGSGFIAEGLWVKMTLHPTDYPSYSALSGYSLLGTSDQLVTDFVPISSLAEGNNIFSWQAPTYTAMTPQSAAVYKISVTLPVTATNVYQGVAYTATLNFRATQWENPGWTE